MLLWTLDILNLPVSLSFSVNKWCHSTLHTIGQLAAVKLWFSDHSEEMRCIRMRLWPQQLRWTQTQTSNMLAVNSPQTSLLWGNSFNHWATLVVTTPAKVAVVGRLVYPVIKPRRLCRLKNKCRSNSFRRCQARLITGPVSIVSVILMRLEASWVLVPREGEGEEG